MPKKTTTPTTAEIVERLKSQFGVNTEGEVADMLSLNPATLSMKKSRNSSILDEVLCLAHEKGIDLNRLLLGKKTEWITLRNDKGAEVQEIQISKKYLDELALDPNTLIVVRQGIAKMYLIDTTVTKITSDGIYAISTENGVLLKRATIRLDGSIIFPSSSNDIPPEHIDKPNVNDLNIVGRAVLILTLPE